MVVVLTRMVGNISTLQANSKSRQAVVVASTWRTLHGVDRGKIMSTLKGDAHLSLCTLFGNCG